MTNIWYTKKIYTGVRKKRHPLIEFLVGILLLPVFYKQLNFPVQFQFEV